MVSAVAFPLPLCSFQGADETRPRLRRVGGFPTTTNTYTNRRGPCQDLSGHYSCPDRIARMRAQTENQRCCDDRCEQSYGLCPRLSMFLQGASRSCRKLYRARLTLSIRRGASKLSTPKGQVLPQNAVTGGTDPGRVGHTPCGRQWMCGRTRRSQSTVRFSVCRTRSTSSWGQWRADALGEAPCPANQPDPNGACRGASAAARHHTCVPAFPGAPLRSSN
jgi:hypothetical protein